MMYQNRYFPNQTIRIHHCRRCVRTFRPHQVVHSTDGKVAGITAGLMAGAVSKNAIVGIGVAIVGALIGHWIDEEVSPKCPICGMVLNVLLDSALRT